MADSSGDRVLGVLSIIGLLILLPPTVFVLIKESNRDHGPPVIADANTPGLCRAAMAANKGGHPDMFEPMSWEGASAVLGLNGHRYTCTVKGDRIRYTTAGQALGWRLAKAAFANVITYSIDANTLTVTIVKGTGKTSTHEFRIVDSAEKSD